jgi:hypothetical protein
VRTADKGLEGDDLPVACVHDRLESKAEIKTDFPLGVERGVLVFNSLMILHGFPYQVPGRQLFLFSSGRSLQGCYLMKFPIRCLHPSNTNRWLVILISHYAVGLAPSF